MKIVDSSKGQELEVEEDYGNGKVRKSNNKINEPAAIGYAVKILYCTS